MQFSKAFATSEILDVRTSYGHDLPYLLNESYLAV